MHVYMLVCVVLCFKVQVKQEDKRMNNKKERTRNSTTKWSKYSTSIMLFEVGTYFFVHYLS